MASAPCPDCFSGTISTATPTGKLTTIHGLPIYVAEPEDGIKPKGIVVIIADAFGYTLVNNQVLADRYAQNGHFLVYLPDFFGGHPMPATIMPLMDTLLKPASWLTTLFYKPILAARALIGVIPFLIRNRPSVMRPRVVAFFQALRSSPPPFPTSSLKIGAAGFCIGGKYAIMLAADPPSSRIAAYSSASVASSSGPLVPLVDAVFAAHPSMISVPDDITTVTRPLSVSVGSDDMALKSNLIVLMKEILEKKGDDHECVILPGAKHGFSIRLDPKDEVQMGFAATAESQALGWFGRWFG